MTERLRVGLAGCGAAALAAHIPALLSLPDRFVITAVSDPDAELAAAVARRLRARALGAEELVHAVDAVHVSSLAALACAAGGGVRGAFLSLPPRPESAEVRERAARVALPVVHGDPHLHDPAWHTLRGWWQELHPERALIRVTIAAGPSAPLLDAQSQPIGPSPAPMTPLELAASALPLLRDLIGPMEGITSLHRGDDVAQAYLRAAGFPAHITALRHDIGCCEWSLDVIGPDVHLRVEFPPPYLVAQAATAVRHDAHGALTAPAVYETGYRAAWRELHRSVIEGTPPACGLEAALADAAAAAELHSAA